MTMALFRKEEIHTDECSILMSAPTFKYVAAAKFLPEFHMLDEQRQNYAVVEDYTQGPEDIVLASRKLGQRV